MLSRLITGLVLGGTFSLAAQTPTYTGVPGDYVAKDFRFGTGETLPALKLHYLTLGTPHRTAVAQRQLAHVDLPRHPHLHQRHREADACLRLRHSRAPYRWSPALGRVRLFDISAKVLDPDMKSLNAMSGEQRSAMVRPMLADRFGAIVHNETKTLAVYDLVLLKDGPKFKAYVPPPGEASSRGPNLGAGSINTRNFNMTATAIPMTSLAEALARQVDKTVIDRTGLAGKYNLTLRFTPDGARRNGEPMEPTDDAPNIYTAIQEQLSLKLVPGKGPVVTLVVDQLKVPSEN